MHTAVSSLLSRLSFTLLEFGVRCRTMPPGADLLILGQIESTNIIVTTINLAYLLLILVTNINSNINYCNITYFYLKDVLMYVVIK